MADYMVAKLRAAGWSVAVHNDYRLNGQPHTFWLLTHPDGRWIKGEGADDAEALLLASKQATIPDPRDATIARLRADLAAAREEVERVRAALIKAENGLDTALGMVEESGFVPSWDYLRECRQTDRAALQEPQT